jgi:hypothetical protein
VALGEGERDVTRRDVSRIGWVEVTRAKAEIEVNGDRMDTLALQLAKGIQSDGGNCLPNPNLVIEKVKVITVDLKKHNGIIKQLKGHPAW